MLPRPTTFLREVIDEGANRILVMTPTTLTGDRDKAVILFCQAIVDNSRLGIFLYPVPSVTRCDLPVELTALLLDNKMVSTKVEASYPGLDCPVWW